MAPRPTQSRMRKVLFGSSLLYEENLSLNWQKALVQLVALVGGLTIY